MNCRNRATGWDATVVGAARGLSDNGFMGRMLIPLAACVLVLSACGDDDSTDSSQPADAGLQVLVEPDHTTPGGTVSAVVVNGSDQDFTYGRDYALERQEGEDFVEVKLPKRPVPMIAYTAHPGERGPGVEVQVPKNALPGQYRVVIQRDVPDVGDLSGEFEVRSEY